MLNKILVSSCLLGQKVRYDGGDCSQNNAILNQWIDEGRVISICPEVKGGLAVPRLPAEIQDSRVMNSEGCDVTDAFGLGAKIALSLCKQHNIKFALLKAKSPSCGNSQIYDGTFSKSLVKGQGITASLLKQNNIHVFNEEEIQELDKMISSL
jgi:uncharacterized protein YbbK (DUF523 family)